MPEIKLKPCPFCGEPAKVCDSPLGFFVECIKLGHLHNTGTLDGAFCKTQQEAIEEWNRRKRK